MRDILITSSVLILALSALRYLLRGRISLRLQYALWLLVAVRLLVPLSLPGTPISILNAVEQAAMTAQQSVSPVLSEQTAPMATAPATPTAPQTPAAAPAAPPTASTAPSKPSTGSPAPVELLKLLWLSGAALMAGWFLFVNLSFRRLVRRSATPADLPECPLPVFVSEVLPSPCLLGLFRPAVYLTPACLTDESRLRHVLAHELTHCRHRDPWWSLIRGICLCIYWFDPLVWWAASLSRRDCELACDEGAIRFLGESQRLAYGRTLVELVAVSGSPARLLQTATTMADRKRGIRERIALIARRPQMMSATLFLVIAAVALTAVCTFTGPRSLSLEARLHDLPASLSQDVHYYDANRLIDHYMGDPDNLALPEGTIFSAYYTLTHSLSSSLGPDHTIGWLGDLYHLAPDQLGNFSPKGAGDGIWECVGKDCSGYYVLLYPLQTPSRYMPAQADQLQLKQCKVQDSFLDWVRQVVLSQPDMEPVTLEEALAMVPAGLPRDLNITSSVSDGLLLSANYADGIWFEVYRHTPGQFETLFFSDIENSGWSCHYRDDQYYYDFLGPMDGAQSQEQQENDSRLYTWLCRVLESQPGMEYYDPTEEINAFFTAPYTYVGQHINAIYYPYYLANGEREIFWTFILSQPVRQGDGGIWCVERWRDAGEFPNTYLAHPRTDMTAVEYYTDLQSQADAGDADWALDPMEVCLRYIRENWEGTVHIGATADCVDLEAPYDSTPGAANEQAETLLAAICGGNQVFVSLTPYKGSLLRSQELVFSPDDTELQSLLKGLVESYDWVDLHSSMPISTDPWADPSLEYGISIQGVSVSSYSAPPALRFYSGSDLAGCAGREPADNNYQLISRNGVPVSDFVKQWFDVHYAGSSAAAAYDAQSAMDAITAGETTFMTMTATDGVGGGRYETAPHSGHTRVYSFGSSFDWTYAESGLPASPEPKYTLQLESPDGAHILYFWEDVDKVLYMDNGQAKWFHAAMIDTGDVFDMDIFTYMRWWYDEVEINGLRSGIVIPDHGQSYLEIAQAWADAYEGALLNVTPGSRWACTYVKSTAEIHENMPESYYPAESNGLERFYFGFETIFVRENNNPDFYHALMAGNTVDYEGADAPENACIHRLGASMYRTREGWVCGGTVTG